MKIDINWIIKEPEKLNLNKFRPYLRDHGHKRSTIASYLIFISKFLESKKAVRDFLAELHIRKPARSTIDNYITSIKK